jgi:SAM-dependent methyltransferase
MERSMSTPTPATPAPSFDAIKTRQQAMWASGDYGQIGTRLQIVGETLCEAVDLRGGERVLDVAAGNGNASLAAARRFCQVTASDYVPELLEKARRRAEADGLPLTCEVADAENLPYADGSFDVVLSVFGVMFTPDQPRAAKQLVRVVKKGGRIALASWTPEGFLGELFRTLGSFVPPPPGLTPPPAWGSEARLQELFGKDVREIRATRRMFNFRFLSAAHWIEVFRTTYGPVLKAYAALQPDKQAELTKALEALLTKHDKGGGRGLVVPAEYLETVITR